MEEKKEANKQKRWDRKKGLIGRRMEGNNNGTRSGGGGVVGVKSFICIENGRRSV